MTVSAERVGPFVGLELRRHCILMPGILRRRLALAQQAAPLAVVPPTTGNRPHGLP